MTDESFHPAPPSSEAAVDQALTILLNAMGQGEPGDTEGQENPHMERDANHLDRLARRCQVAGEALQLRAALFRRQRNALFPINRLPLELISNILVQSLNNDRRPRTEALQELAQVQWRWWQIVKSDAQFWTYISPPLKSVELHIRKAGGLPLHLDWEFTEDYPNKFRFQQFLEDHAERWASIDFEGYHDDFGLRMFCTERFPHLKYLNLRQTNAELEGSWRLNIARYPNVQEAHLPITPYFASSSSNPPIRLRTLRLDLSSMNTLSFGDLESLLQLTPQLVELEVANVFTDTSPPSPPDAPIINLPMLRRLAFLNVVLEGDREGVPLIARIRAPQLVDFGSQYGFDPEGWPITMSAHTIFNELLTRPGASLNRPDDAPMVAVLRTACPSPSWTLALGANHIKITVNGSGQGRMDISFYTDNVQRDLTEHTLVQLAPFGALPIDIHVFWPQTFPKLDFWDMALDAMPSLRSFTVDCPLQVAQQLMNRLSTRAPSSSTSGPRAPRLENIRFLSRPSFFVPWSEGDEGDGVKNMLDERRSLFIEAGILSPPKMTVTGPKGFIYNDVESGWLAPSNPDSGE